jgi:hypothetical protein
MKMITRPSLFPIPEEVSVQKCFGFLFHNDIQLRVKQLWITLHMGVSDASGIDFNYRVICLHRGHTVA